jgi:hypothetical protein
MLESLRRFIASKVGLMYEPLDCFPANAEALALAANLKANRGDRIDAVHHHTGGLSRV